MDGWRSVTRLCGVMMILLTGCVRARAVCPVASSLSTKKDAQPFSSEHDHHSTHHSGEKWIFLNVPPETLGKTKRSLPEVTPSQAGKNPVKKITCPLFQRFAHVCSCYKMTCSTTFCVYRLSVVDRALFWRKWIWWWLYVHACLLTSRMKSPRTVLCTTGSSCPQAISKLWNYRKMIQNMRIVGAT